MAAYYNEIEPYAAEWLRNLIKAGHIPHGEVDTRSIVDVAPDDLRAFTQCHFFAGIGGWGYALRLARWPDDRPIWTGSCPCQPFSVAGKGAGVNDARHLWPHFHRLIAARRPPVVMGEQVAGKAGYGWFDGVRADLEETGYAGRAVDIPALAVNAPHIRQRLYWVALDMADASNQRRKRDAGKLGEPQPLYEREEPIAGGSSQETFDSRSRNPSHMADASIIRREERERKDRQQNAGGGSQGRVDVAGAGADHMADTTLSGRGQRISNAGGMREGDCPQGPSGRPSQHGNAQPVHMADAASTGLQGSCNAGERAAGMGSQQPPGDSGGDHMADANVSGLRQRGGDHPPAGHGHPAAPEGRSGHWDDHVWIAGSDGKARRSKPGLPLLAHGIPNRVGRLRAYGNAIVPQVAAEVITAYMESI